MKPQPRRRAALLVAVLAVTAATLAAVPATVAPTGRAGAVPAQSELPVGLPLVGDFDGDRRTDVFWYGPGSNPDHHWYGRANRQFGGRAISIGRSYQPIIGDFDGDGRSDIFWYGPGSGADVVYYGTSGHGFAGKNVTVSGTYQPFTGDFDGDGRTDIFWYAPGTASDAIWYGTSSRTFAGKGITISRTYQPLVGDFDGDRRSDILWYGPGSATDVLYYGTASRTFAGKAITIGRTYQPLLGDFDGDGRSDIFWYGPGSAADVLYYGTSSRTFAGKAITISGTYQAFTGDFDGDRRTDVFWYRPGSGSDVVYYGTSSRTFAGKSATVNRTYQPVVGDFDGGGRSDVLWWAPGAADDVVWFGVAGRAFTGRPTTIDLAYQRPPPLQQQSLVSAYNPYGYIAHAGGGYEGRTYTNSRDAVLHNYGRGFRVFELDFVVLRDGTVLAAHTGLENYYGLSKPFQDATWAEIAGRRFDGQYTIMRSDEVVQLLRDHPDMYVVLDTKYQHDHIFRRFVSQTGGSHALMDRVIPHVKDQAELDLYRNTWPLRNYLMALYRTQYVGAFDDPAVVSFVRNNRAPGVMMWWQDRDPALTLSQNHFQSRRFTPTFAQQLQAAGAVVFVHNIRDDAAVPRFESLAVGIYSDGPFAGPTQRSVEPDPPPPDQDPVSPEGQLPA
ncbi:MAG TPA: FG-GAP-like repeat-containing protein [Acidimicrobiales bacterium]|nr:FG-GAP-like repeat-containing protein [Acidimicrobiales bacterium]